LNFIKFGQYLKPNDKGPGNNNETFDHSDKSRAQNG